MNTDVEISTESFCELSHSYRQFVRHIRENPFLLRVVTNSVPPSDCRGISSLLLKACRDTTTIMSLLGQLVQAECEFDPSVFMRERSRLSNRTTGDFIQEVGDGFLRKMLEGLCTAILLDPELTLECDPEMEDYAPENRDKLIAMTQNFLDHIFSKSTIESYPRSIRALASVVASYSKKFKGTKDSWYPLVGNLIFLRFICPYIVICDSLEITPSHLKVTDRARRNLKLIAKVIQTLSNASDGSYMDENPFASKEPYMTFLIDWVNLKVPDIRHHLEEIVTDEQGINFTDLIADPDHPCITPLEAHTIRMNDFSLRELASCHRMFAKPVNQNKIEKEYRRIGKDDEHIEVEITRLMNLLSLLGDPPLILPAPWVDVKNPAIRELKVSVLMQPEDHHLKSIKGTYHLQITQTTIMLVNFKKSSTSASVIIDSAPRSDKLAKIVVYEFHSEEISKITSKGSVIALHLNSKSHCGVHASLPFDKGRITLSFDEQHIHDETLGETFELFFRAGDPDLFEGVKANMSIDSTKFSGTLRITSDSVMLCKKNRVVLEFHLLVIKLAVPTAEHVLLIRLHNGTNVTVTTKSDLRDKIMAAIDQQRKEIAKR